jgi:hypothetical protein
MHEAVNRAVDLFPSSSALSSSDAHAPFSYADTNSRINDVSRLLVAGIQVQLSSKLQYEKYLNFQSCSQCTSARSSDRTGV